MNRIYQRISDWRVLRRKILAASRVGRLVACASAVAMPMVQAQQSTLRPASAHAEGIATLWWVMFYGSVLIFVAVMVVLGVGLWRARRGPAEALSPLASRNLVIAAGVVVPLVTVIALVGGSLLLGRSMAQQPPEGALGVRITGWMWWWQIEYLDEQGQVVATTANELHVPVGRPVDLHLASADVIHSFWVPQLHGKTDMVPGVTNRSWFTARETGIYRGQCAEFCGTQHALMAFQVVAQPEEEFDRWLRQQAQPANTPDSEQLHRGQQVFMDAGCAGCHSIRGTQAEGRLAPDLTHFGSRQTIAAATRANNSGHLAGWIADPQSIKPGSFMPPTLLEPHQLLDLVAYLQSLE